MSFSRNIAGSESPRLAAPINDSFFTAIVVDSDPATYCVEVAPLTQTKKAILQGIPIAQQLTNMLGMKEAYLPPIGSTVLCLAAKAKYCYVIGVIPEADLGGSGAGQPLRSSFGGGDGDSDNANRLGYGGKSSSKLNIINNNRPTDVVDGEYVKSNEFGVLLGLFQNFACLKASELSQIQTYVLDDLVRIISHNFQHYHSMGQFSISHDGQSLNLECGLTHDPIEAQGRPQTGSLNNFSVMSLTGNIDKDDKDSIVKLEDEKLKAVERLKIFVGKLGDLVRIMLVRPDDQELRLNNGEDPTKPDTGLFDFHLDMDGGAYLRSVKGIFIEKTNWIRVPHRKQSEEDPTGDDATQFNYDRKESFKFDKTYNYKDQPFLYFLQLRDYMAYMNETYGYKNFKKHEKDFHVNDDVNNETKIDSIVEVDPLSATKYEKRTSGFYMMPNGGIMMKDAWGSAIVLEGGNIYFQAAKDEIHQPMRNFIAKVGQFTSIASKKDIDFSSTEGGARIKTDKVQHFYSENGGIIIQTDNEGGPDYIPEDQAITDTAGIVIKSKSGIYSYADQYNIRAIGTCTVRSKDLVLQGDGSAWFISEKDMIIFSPRSLAVGTKGQLVVASTEGQAVFFGDGATVVGKEEQEFGVCPLGPVTGFLTEDNIKDFKNFENTIDGFSTTTFLSNFKEDEIWDNLKFRFLDSSSYSINTATDPIPKTLVQIEEENFEALHNLHTWEERQINDTYPYPGADNAEILVGGVMNNIEVLEGELYNKTDNEELGTIETATNIFTDYKTL